MQHERNHDDAWLAARGLKRLDIDPNRVQMRWAIDFCAQGLRNVEIGLGGGALDGFQMKSGFYITVASEVMAILAMSADLADLRKRLSKIVVAYAKDGKPVTTADLEVDGAMCALLVNAIKPTLMQSIEGQPVFVHAGPFANIAIGQNSVVADRLACALGDYVVTESGFASDICSRRAATTCSRTSTSSAAAACSRSCASTRSTPTRPPSATSCAAWQKAPARASP